MVAVLSLVDPTLRLMVAELLRAPRYVYTYFNVFDVLINGSGAILCT